MAFDIVVIGTSLGGMRALETVLEGIPAAFPAPVAVVQHRSAEPSTVLRMVLQRRTKLKVSEAQDKDEILPGHVYIAPPDYHLLVEPGSFALSVDPPVSYARPSIDVLFETAAEAYGAGVIGVILTGANHDGARGVAAIKAEGGVVVAQAPETAESRVMPAAAIAATTVDYVVTLEEVGPLLGRLCCDNSH